MNREIGQRCMKSQPFSALFFIFAVVVCLKSERYAEGLAAFAGVCASISELLPIINSYCSDVEYKSG
jgi:phosphotransferase system  glucose/maltose/N-acetylglucosamine-specific IIC component